MENRRAISSKRETWPFAGPEHVFLFEALERIGQKDVPDWTGKTVWLAGPKLRELCASKKLTAAFRWEHDGLYSEIDSHRWHTEVYRRWLIHGDAQLSEVWSVPGADRHYLFIECAGLDAYLDDIKSPGETPSKASSADPLVPPPYLSPFIHLMMEAVKEFGISETSHGKKHTLVEHFKAQTLPDGRKVSTYAAESMATLCRHPDAQRGGNKRVG